MCSKIVYLVCAPFNKRDYRRFGIEIFRKNGFNVEVWDLTPCLYSVANKKVFPPDMFKYTNLIKFSKKRDAVHAISREKDRSVFIVLFAYDINTFAIFKALWKSRCSYVLAWSNIGRMPGNIDEKKDIDKNNNSRKVRRVMRLTPDKLIRYSYNKLSSWLLRLPSVRTATIYMAGGSRSLTKTPLVGPTTEILWVHTFDYDVFLEKQRTTFPEKSEGIVFLDQYLPFHPDFLFAGREHITTADEYYPQLCRLFAFLEEKLGEQVIIAAHPRSHYEKHQDLFGGRTIIRGKTVELVKDAKLVVLHYSAAMNFAVLYKRPMLFVTTNSLEESNQGPRIQGFASYFNKSPVNIDNIVDFDLEKELSVYEQGYERYMNEFIKVKGSEEIPQWMALCKRIKALSV